MEFNLLDFMLTNKDLVTKDRPLRLRLDYCTRMSDDLLLPQRVYGTQSMCGGIEYRILCVSIRYDIQLKDLIGVAAGLDFVTDQGELHSVCGIITEVSAGDSDGGLASYQIVLRDALALLERRTNTRVFRYKNEVDIVQLIIEEWRKANAMLGIAFEFAVDSAFGLHTYPPREFTMQHNETDAAFIRRLLKRRGIAWHFQARHGGDYPHHTLVLSNNVHGLRASSAGTVRYHRDGPCEQRDTITSWSAVRTLQPSSVELFSWDYKRPNDAYSSSAGVNSGAKQGLYAEGFAATLDDYLVMPPHSGDDPQDLRRLGQLQMARHDYEAKCFHGEGTVRDFACGEYFSLEWHPEIDTHLPQDREFTITALQVAAMNNLPKVIGERMERLFARNRWLQHGQDGWLQRELSEQAADGGVRMRIHFSAVRRDTPVVPAYDPRTDLPQPQMQSAIVVGPEGEEVHCDELGRVKIRFPATRWQDHHHMEGAGARNDQSDSAWVRVATNWAGNGNGSQQQCGALGLPRVGSEVLVSFMGGDPDKPVIVAQLFNAVGRPIALSAAGDLPGNRNLSGIKSREIKGRRINQLRFDDTTGQISAQLASDHGASQLNMGVLTEPRSKGYGKPRGEGVELRSDEQIAIRAAKGILLTASGQLNASGKQMERSDLQDLLVECLKLAKSLGEYAAQHQGIPSQTNALDELNTALESWDNGSSVAPKSQGGGAAAIAISAPEGMCEATRKAMLLYAGSTLDLVAQQNLQISGGAAVNLNAVSGVSVFSQNDGIRLISHKKKLLLYSQSDDTELTSAKNVRLTADVSMSAVAEEIVLATKDGSYLKIGNGIEFGTSKELRFHAEGFRFLSPRTRAVTNVGKTLVPIQNYFNDRFLLLDECTGDPMAYTEYAVVRSSGEVEFGTTDAQGRTHVLSSTDEPESVQIFA